MHCRICGVKMLPTILDVCIFCNEYLYEGCSEQEVKEIISKNKSSKMKNGCSSEIER